MSRHKLIPWQQFLEMADSETLCLKSQQQLMLENEMLAGTTWTHWAVLPLASCQVESQSRMPSINLKPMYDSLLVPAEHWCIAFLSAKLGRNNSGNLSEASVLKQNGIQILPCSLFQPETSQVLCRLATAAQL